MTNRKSAKVETDSNTVTKRRSPKLTATERSMLAYRRRKDTHKFVRIMLLNETRDQLSELVKRTGMSQNDYLEYIIKREFEIVKSQKED